MARNGPRVPRRSAPAADCHAGLSGRAPCACRRSRAAPCAVSAKPGTIAVGILKGRFGIAEVARRRQAPGIRNRRAGLGEPWLADGPAGAGGGAGRGRPDRRCGRRVGAGAGAACGRLRRRVLSLVALIDVEPACRPRRRRVRRSRRKAGHFRFLGCRRSPLTMSPCES